VYNVDHNALFAEVQARLAGSTSFFKMGMINDWLTDYPQFMALIAAFPTLHDGELVNISSVMVDPDNPAQVILTDKDDKVLYPGSKNGKKYTRHWLM
jgi:hypothetical protein